MFDHTAQYWQTKGRTEFLDCTLSIKHITPDKPIVYSGIDLNISTYGHQ
jgi:hypothetical protein